MYHTIAKKNKYMKNSSLITSHDCVNSIKRISFISSDLRNFSLSLRQEKNCKNMWKLMVDVKRKENAIRSYEMCKWICQTHIYIYIHSKNVPMAINSCREYFHHLFYSCNVNLNVAAGLEFRKQKHIYFIFMKTKNE